MDYLVYVRVVNYYLVLPTLNSEEPKKSKIFAKGFYKHFGITKTGKFAVKYIPEENTIYVDLNKSL